MADTVVQTVPLGPRWPMLDPFLFCAHHDDAYPPGNDVAGPAVALDGRDLGQDFEGIDGWRMYHGQRVPGFPGHPHRGFETVTYVRRGLIDHSDSLGAAARFGRGDVQWLTAGAGIVHAEMFPLLDRERANPLELFQIWLNLPAEDKLVPPHFSMLWDGDIPRVRHADAAGRSVEVTLIAGGLDGRVPPPPPPHSWAARPGSDVAIWHLVLDPGSSWTLPAATGAGTIRTLYVFEGAGIVVDGTDVPGRTGAVVRCDRPADLASPGGAEVLLLQGRPIGEPVAQYGPFVMNDEQGLEQAFADYRATGFGGWPWPSEEPVHHGEAGRFARHPDGTRDEPSVA
jgi:redox-sensitive bicupin YhaK (pirin superfamily)